MGKPFLSNSQLFGAGRIGPPQTFVFYFQSYVIIGDPYIESYIIGDSMGFVEKFRRANSDIDTFYSAIDPDPNFFAPVPDPANYFDYLSLLSNRSSATLPALVTIRGEQMSYSSIMSYLGTKQLYVSGINIQSWNKSSIGLNGVTFTAADNISKLPKIGLISENINNVQRDFSSQYIYDDPAISSLQDGGIIIKIPCDVVLSKTTGLIFRRPAPVLDREESNLLNISLTVHTWEKE